MKVFSVVPRWRPPASAHPTPFLSPIPFFRLPILLLSLTLSITACSRIQPWVEEGTAPRPPDFPPRGESAPGEMGGRKVTVRYDVSCTVCEIQFTDSRGEQKDLGRNTGSWRHREHVPSGHRTVTLVVTPGRENARVHSVQIQVEGSQATRADIPTGGVVETVVISASLPVG